MAFSARGDGPAGISLVLDGRDWQRLTQDLKRFNPALVRSLRRELRGVGQFAVEDVRRKLGMPSPDDGPDTGEYRRRLAAAAKVSLSFSTRTAGVSISTTNKDIPDAHKAIMRAYNRNTFRHPLFGDRSDWVEQRGRPYFGGVFEQMVFDTAIRSVNAALGYALSELDRYRSAA